MMSALFALVIMAINLRDVMLRKIAKMQNIIA